MTSKFFQMPAAVPCPSTPGWLFSPAAGDVDGDGRQEIVALASGQNSLFFMTLSQLKRGELTPSEFEEMKLHTTLGAQTLEAVKTRYPRNEFLRVGIEIARCHHERWDGQGYPAGLAGTDIPLSARIMAVADVVAAMAAPRAHRPAHDIDSALAHITEMRGVWYDEAAVDACVQIFSRQDFTLH